MPQQRKIRVRRALSKCVRDVQQQYIYRLEFSSFALFFVAVVYRKKKNKKLRLPIGGCVYVYCVHNKSSCPYVSYVSSYFYDHSYTHTQIVLGSEEQSELLCSCAHLKRASLVVD